MSQLMPLRLAEIIDSVGWNEVIKLTGQFIRQKGLKEEYMAFLEETMQSGWQEKVVPEKGWQRAADGLQICNV